MAEKKVYTGTGHRKSSIARVRMTSGKGKITVNGKTFTGKTNDKGKVTFKITNLNKKGTYKATISYKGDKTYEEAEKTVKLTIK